MASNCVFDAVASVYNQLVQTRPLCQQRFDAAKVVGYESWRQFPSNVNPYSWSNFTSFAYEVRDRRVDGWPLMDSPLTTIGCAFAYITLVLVGMYVIMKNRPALVTGLRPMMIIYNFIVILINVYMFVGLVYYAYIRGGYSILCNPVDYDATKDGEAEYEVLKIAYIYFLSKLLDFSDTFFMVVRRKFDQVSFLHVYHHSSMLLIWWGGVKYGGGGDLMFGPMLNSFVHIVMYSYYLAALFKTRIPGKSHVTKLQLAQFFMVISQSTSSILLNCPYPHFALYIQTVFLTSLFVLFMQFYVKAYGLAGDKSKLKKAAAVQAAKAADLVVVGKSIAPPVKEKIETASPASPPTKTTATGKGKKEMPAASSPAFKAALSKPAPKGRAASTKRK